MLRTTFAGRDKAVMQPEEVRALRDELGWTQEQLADAVGVSPLEVSAWETGAVSVRLDDAVQLVGAASRERRDRAWDAADARPCAWGADARARLAAADGVDFALAKECKAHEKGCAACRRAAEVEQALPPPPSLPLPLSPGGLLAFVLRTTRLGDRLPAPLRTAGRLAIFGGWLVLLMMGLALLRFVVDPAAGFELSFTPVLYVLTLFSGWLVAAALWDEVYPARGFRADVLKAATTAALVIAMTLLGMDPSEQAGAGFFALMAVFLVRDRLRPKDADAQPVEQNALSASGAVPDALPGPRVEPDLEPSPREPVAAARHLPEQHPPSAH